MKRTFDLVSSVSQSEIHRKVALVERNPDGFGSNSLGDVSIAFKQITAELTVLASEVDKADKFAHAAAVNRLQLIAEQMKFLQNQACSVIVGLRKGLALNHVACNFKKVPGKIYHLYQRTNGYKYFSMLSPEEWSDTMPHSFVGSFRLEPDMTWTPASEFEAKEDSLKMIGDIISRPGMLEEESAIGSERMLLDNT